ncbi:response regulator [Aureimonas ureilytica]|uniref:Response regulator n=2 Tax=Aureimonas ureilytica TaxID=401562 RepID=A0A175RC18_9HYPH|nr:response regulator [Aureimonas ureilytica]KTQ97698.1 response regulator [Aureimonas ureilytica]KTR05420.1 response regulator [Aureimonas ureilytica]
MTEPKGLEGLRIFAVEDESLVAMQLEDILDELGCVVAGLAMRVDRAQAMLDAEPGIDAAILDMNIAGVKVYPVAERLRERNVPIVFATGYGLEGIEMEWRVFPVLQKPYTAEQIARALLQAIPLTNK